MALVLAPLGVPLTIEFRVIPGLTISTVKLLFELTQPVLEFLTVATKLYVLAELAGIVTLIGFEGKVALVTFEKPGITLGEPVKIEY